MGPFTEFFVMKFICVYITLFIIVDVVYGQISLPIYHRPSPHGRLRRYVIKLFILYQAFMMMYRSLRVNGSTSIIEGNDYVPYTSLSIGGNRQVLSGILLDTGSSPLWTQSSTCKTGCWPCTFNTNNYPDAVCRGSSPTSQASNTCDFLKSLGTSPVYANKCTGSTFDPASSSSYQLDYTLGPFVIQYGDGSTYIGQYVSDTISLGPAVYDGFTFALVTQESYGGGSIDGILGLAPPEYSTASTLLTYMSQDTNMTTKQFSFYYPDQLPGTGELCIGGTNTSLYTGNITWVMAYFQKYWNIAGDSVWAENMSGRRSGSGAAAIIDTGTSQLLGPSTDVSTIANWLGLSYDQSSDTYYTSCSTMNELPNFYINFGYGVKLLIDTQNNFNGGEFARDSYGSTLCAANIKGGRDNPPQWIIGSIVLRQYYVVFDFSNFQPSSNLDATMGAGKVGFAARIGGAIPVHSNGGWLNGMSLTAILVPIGGAILLCAMCQLLFNHCKRRRFNNQQNF